MFLCPACGLAHEPVEGGLETFTPVTVRPTTELAASGPVRHLAVWQVAVKVDAQVDSAWERIRRVVSPAEPHVYVPAFSMIRPVVQRLGLSLTEAQPELVAAEGPPGSKSRRPSLVDGEAAERADVPPGDDARDRAAGPVTPVVLGRRDARVLANFVFLAVESHEKHELHSVEYQLEPTGEELFFLPAVWDPRYMRESSWRLLLREFDGLVA